MPKEIIQNAHQDPDSRRFVTEVRWNRERYVQLATVKTPETGWTEPAEGMYVDLDRAGVNRLIQVLRRARDQAFGADA